MKTFEPKNKNLIEIFSDNNRYEVPRFQRGYDWGMEQIRDFWIDLESVNQKDKDSVFFGNFIFLNADPEKNVLSIIDGQQRIITLQILLIAIRTRAKKLNSKLNDNALQISNINSLIEYYGSKFVNQGGTELKKVTVAKSIKHLFNLMSEYKWDGVIPDKIVDLDGRVYRKIRRKIEPVYNFFFDKIKDLNTEELADILGSLEKIFVTKIEIQDPIEAFDIFERTNARGVRLAQSDLVKNLLFQKTDEVFHDDIDKIWSDIATNSSDKLGQMLKYYVVTFNGKTLKKEIFPILSRSVKEKTAKILINELLDFSLFYKMMSTEGTTSDELSSMTIYFKVIGFGSILEDHARRKSITRSITSFQLFNITQVYPLLFSYIKCLHRCKKDIEVQNKNSKKKKTPGEYLLKFMQRLENFHFVNTIICNNIGNQVESLYSEYSKRFCFAENLEMLIDIEREFKKALLDLRESKKTFTSKFTEVNYEDGDKRLVVYIFDRLSNAESKGAQIYDLYNPDTVIKKKDSNIEHFYPKKVFEQLKDSIGTDFGNNIGNLLVLSVHTNSSFHDALPIDKYNMIKEKSKYLINIGNKEFIIMKYENRKWDKELIARRATDLAEYGFDKAWSVNI